MARPKKTKEDMPNSPTESLDQASESVPVGHAVVKTPVEIIPSIQVIGGPKNALLNLFEGDHEKLPILKSVGYGQIPGTNTFVSYIIYSKGQNILKIEVEEPNLRAIAEESAKMFFVNTFMTGDEHVPG
jgi:hypothetical protein